MHRSSVSPDPALQDRPPDGGATARRRRLVPLAVASALACAVVLLDVRWFVPFSTLTGRHDNASFNFPIRLEVARQ
ncbi:MAG: hypothetical protein FJ148_07330 [Deltaproteobacteria bacterium]|nr:hypothetical protein [Deltaproteobacteria bacterium]